MIHRPSPEDLLRRVQADERRERRGRLKVFLGYASRVGKSFRMFGEGRRRKERGQDVVVCAVQREIPPDVHEIVDCLEVMPTDVDAIIRRHPQVCLIDELAYDNPPGSRNRHRWQDVSEILDHGISVITAVNLQYIREQQDAVERITGKRSAYAVPAEFLREADEIELVDAVADSRPMAELRELALLFAADVVDRQLQGYLESHGLAIRGSAQERILVCLTPHANCEEMLRSGRRNADRFHGGLLAVYLEQDGDKLAPALALARDLDADLHGLQGSSLVRGVIDFARERQVTQVFISHAAEGKRALDRLIEESEQFDVRLFPPTSAAPEHLTSSRPPAALHLTSEALDPPAPPRRFAPLPSGSQSPASAAPEPPTPPRQFRPPPPGSTTPTSGAPEPPALRHTPRSLTPTPGEILRGNLKIYLGYAAGVGKTYRMLDEAQTLRQQGVDVVIGYFEPHGRKETIAKTEGLEAVTRRVLSYAGTRFEEMDTPAILRRRPAVAVVDEFAHTNVPGSERTKRWEDVRILLDAGIDVLTTMNIQHLESLNDQVWHATGVRVRETVPDWVVDEADEVVFVDLTTRALRNRLERGVVYHSEKARHAMDNFFTEANLIALREMAMRHTAHEVEDKLDVPLAGHDSARHERILICLTGSPSSAGLIRRGKRVADYLQAGCVAVHVTSQPNHDEAVQRLLSFARNLRIETHVLHSSEVPRSIVEFARSKGVTQVFLGRSKPRTWWQRPGASVVQRLVRQAGDMQITIVAERRR